MITLKEHQATESYNKIGGAIAVVLVQFTCSAAEETQKKVNSGAAPSL